MPKNNRACETTKLMQTSKAIIIGSTIIGLCVLAHLGYTISRDMAGAEAAERQHDQQAKAYKNAQSKEAWAKAIKFIDVALTKWLETELKTKYIREFEWGWVKSFNLSDVEWNDARHITVHGVIGVTPKGDSSGEHIFSWVRNVELKNDGVDNWWQADRDVVFANATLTKDQSSHMPTKGIIMPSENGIPEALPAIR
jgi:hypothetical protein